MNLLQSAPLPLRSSSISEEDILIKKLLLIHDPDGRRLDSELLLCAVEKIMSYATASNASNLLFDAVSDIKVAGSQELLGLVIHKIACVIHCKCSSEGDLCTRTMNLFDLLGNYSWDAKLVLVLAAFAISYGKFLLLMELYTSDPLGVSVALLKQLPSDLSAKLKPRFKALRLLVSAMVNLTKCIIKFEGFPLKHVELDNGAIGVTKSQIYVATYQVIKSALICSSQITDLTTMRHEEVNSNSATIAVWELLSLSLRLSSIYCQLRKQVDVCHQQIDTKMHQNLLHLFKDTHIDNQEVLHMLFALKDELPLKEFSSQRKIGVSELKNKVVILLVSKPEFVLMEWLFLLVQQMYDHVQKKLEETYEIVWVPIQASDTWTESEQRSFNFFSESLPWYSIREPWLLGSAVVSYVKQVWSFKDDPLMIVLDSQGVITHTNAIDMILIWGAQAYPFSTSREKELWEEEKWTLDLMVDDIDPLVSKMVEDGRNLCIYGGDNLEWIRELNAKMKEITSTGMKVEMVYVGKRDPSENVKKILAIIDEEKLSDYVSLTKIHFFWIRLESMRRSKLQTGKISDTDYILEELEALLHVEDNDKGWAVMGKGNLTDIVKLQGKEVMECLNLFSVWGVHVEKLGFLGAVKTILESPLRVAPCCDANVVPYVEGLTEGSVVCDKCRRPMEKFVVYKCNGFK